MTGTARKQAARRGPLVAVPLYRSPQLIEDLFGSLAAMADELATLDARILLIDDSPGDAGLDAALATHLPALASVCDVTLVHNAANLGFVRTANRALSQALEEGRDAILLNSDAIPVPGAFAEMAAVAALDPRACVVSPRSDNATICNSPYPDTLRRWKAALPAHREIEPLLPRVSIVPTAVGFCLYVPNAILARFGLFDEIYGAGYNEENDFIRRCVAHGYHALLANRAFVFHLMGVSFDAVDESRKARDDVNGRILNARYPEYAPAVSEWFDGPDFYTQYLLAGLVPSPDGRMRLLFDCRGFDAHDDAAVASRRELLVRFAAAHAGRWDIRAIAPRAAGLRHRLDAIDGVRLVNAKTAFDTPAAIACRLDTPPTFDAVTTLADFAPLVGFLVDGPAPNRGVLGYASGIASFIGRSDGMARRRAANGTAPIEFAATDEHTLATTFEDALAGIRYDAVHRRQRHVTHNRWRMRSGLATVPADVFGRGARLRRWLARLGALAGRRPEPFAFRPRSG